MFYIYVVKDSLIISPEPQTSDSLFKMLIDRYLFKHLQNQGIVIQVLNYKVENAKILNESCNLSLTLEISFLVFCPPLGTLLEGVVKENNEFGLVVQLTVNDQTLVKMQLPGNLMNKGAIWDNIRQVWVWQINDRKGEYTEGEKIRVRVAKNQLNVRNANGDIIVRCDEDGLGLIKWWNI